MNLNGDVLKGWLRRMDAMEKGSTRKEQFVRAIEAQLTDNLSGVIARLSLEEKSWLAECAHHGRSAGDTGHPSAPGDPHCSLRAISSNCPARRRSLMVMPPASCVSRSMVTRL